MKALTIKPHFAHAIAFLGKRIENRAKAIPRNSPPGTRIAIHAGASLPSGWADQLRAACPTGPNRLDLLVGQVTQTAWYEGEPEHRSIHMRGIVATAVLARCVDAHRGTQGQPWADPAAAFWWHLEDVRVLEHPIHVERGQLGLWNLSDDVAAMLEVNDDR